MALNPTGPPDPSKDVDDLLNGGPLAANLVGGDDGQGGGQGEDADTLTERRAGGGYSKFVTWMKVLLPFVALGLIALVIAWPRLKANDGFRIGFSSIRLSGEAQPGMDNARYVGTDETQQPFSVTADLARIISQTDGEMALELPKADLTLEDGTWLVLTADTGRYKRSPPTLELQGGVNLFHDTGYEISTDQLMVHLKTGMAEGHTPVVGHGPFGELKSQGLKLIDKGRVIYFTGPARLILYTPQNGG